MTSRHPPFEKPFANNIQWSYGNSSSPCHNDDHAVTQDVFMFGQHKERDGYSPKQDRRPHSTSRTSLRMLWTRHRLWALPALFSLVIVLLTWPVESSQLSARADPPRQSTGLTDAVQWDNYTLFVNEQRIFL